MGAEAFQTGAHGKTMDEAFNTAVNDAAYDYGHAGYTGTIAEKQGYYLIGVPQGFNHDDMIEGMERAAYGDFITPAWEAFIKTQGAQEAERAASIYNDKWGQCIAMRMQGHPNRWCFAGYASS
jgi:hypothetical protein